ncbi:MAG: hypothetical protein AAGK09_15085 [Planctomycetota bacterium]
MVAITELPPSGAELLNDSLEAAEQAYRKAVLKAVETNQTPKNLPTLLANASRTRHDFARHFDQLVARRAAAASIEGTRDLEDAIPALEQQIAIAGEQIESLRAQHREELAPLIDEHQQRVDEFRRLRGEPSRLRREAQQTLSMNRCPDELAAWTEVQERASLARAEARRLVGEKRLREEAVANAERALEHCRSEEERLREYEGNEIHGKLFVAAQENLAAADERLADCRQRVAAIDDACKAADAAEAELARATEKLNDWRHMAFD